MSPPHPGTEGADFERHNDYSKHSAELDSVISSVFAIVRAVGRDGRGCRRTPITPETGLLRRGHNDEFYGALSDGWTSAPSTGGRRLAACDVALACSSGQILDGLGEDPSQFAQGLDGPGSVPWPALAVLGIYRVEVGRDP